MGLQDNNRAELCAACRAIRMAVSLQKAEITIRTDSECVICALVTPKNRRGEFLNILCGDLMDSIDSLKSRIKVTGEYVKGHSNDFGNEEAHKLAQNGANFWKMNENLTTDVQASIINRKIAGSSKSIDNNQKI